MNMNRFREKMQSLKDRVSNAALAVPGNSGTGGMSGISNVPQLPMSTQVSSVSMSSSSQISMERQRGNGRSGTRSPHETQRDVREDPDISGVACVRIPVEAARKLQLFDNGDLEKIIIEHTREKKMLITANEKMKEKLKMMGVSVQENANARAAISKSDVDEELTAPSQLLIIEAKLDECLLLSAHGEIERMRKFLSKIEQEKKKLNETIHKMEWQRDEMMDKIRKNSSGTGDKIEVKANNDWGDDDWGEDFGNDGEKPESSNDNIAETEDGWGGDDEWQEEWEDMDGTKQPTASDSSSRLSLHERPRENSAVLESINNEDEIILRKKVETLRESLKSSQHLQEELHDNLTELYDAIVDDEVVLMNNYNIHQPVKIMKDQQMAAVASGHDKDSISIVNGAIEVYKEVMKCLVSTERRAIDCEKHIKKQNLQISTLKANQTDEQKNKQKGMESADYEGFQKGESTLDADNNLLDEMKIKLLTVKKALAASEEKVATLIRDGDDMKSKLCEQSQSLTELENEKNYLTEELKTMQTNLQDSVESARKKLMLHHQDELKMIREEVAETNSRLTSLQLKYVGLQNEMEIKVAQLAADKERKSCDESKINSLSKTIKDRDDTIRNLRESINMNFQEMESVKADAGDLAALRQSYSNLKEEFESSIKRHTSHAEQLQKENHHYSKTIENSNIELNSIKAANAKLLNSIEHLQKNLNNETERADAQQSQVSALEVQLSKAITAINDTKQQQTEVVGETESKIQAFKDELMESKEKLAVANMRIKNLETEKMGITEELRNCEQELEIQKTETDAARQMISSCHETESEIEDLQNRCRELEISLSSARGKIASLNDDKTNSKVNIEILEDKVGALVSERNKVKAELDLTNMKLKTADDIQMRKDVLIDNLEQDLGQIKKEFESVRCASSADISDYEVMIKEKERKIAKLSEENNEMMKSFTSKDTTISDMQAEVSTLKEKIRLIEGLQIMALDVEGDSDSEFASSVAVESTATPMNGNDTYKQFSQHLKLQSDRDENISKLKTEINILRRQLEDSEATENLQMQSLHILRDELAEYQRQERRESLYGGHTGVNGKNVKQDMTYLKNVIVKYMEYGGQHDVLIPVIGQLLAFSPDDFHKIEKAKSSTNSLLSLPENLSSLQDLQDGISSLMFRRPTLSPRK